MQSWCFRFGGRGAITLRRGRIQKSFLSTVEIRSAITARMRFAVLIWVELMFRRSFPIKNSQTPPPLLPFDQKNNGRHPAAAVPERALRCLNDTDRAHGQRSVQKGHSRTKPCRARDRQRRNSAADIRKKLTVPCSLCVGFIIARPPIAPVPACLHHEGAVRGADRLRAG